MAADVLFLGCSHLRWSHQYPISLPILIKVLLGVTCLVTDKGEGCEECEGGEPTLWYNPS